MSQAESSSNSITLEQFIAFNQEMIALTRAGIPLELGLRRASLELQGSLRQMVDELASQLEQGVPLTEALSRLRHPPPPAYQSLVQAGIRSGNLSLALENVTAFANSTLELRRQLTLTFLYPLIVLVMAYSLFVAVTIGLTPGLAAAFRSFGADDLQVLTWMEKFGASIWIWGPIFPACLLVLIFWWWYSGRRSRWLGGGGPLMLIPGMNNLVKWGQLSSFSELFATLLAHQVPLDEAFFLSAHAAGTRGLRHDARRFAIATQQGASFAESIRGLSSIPPYLKWTLSSSSSPEGLVKSLRQVSRFYRQRAKEWMEFLRIFLPPLMVVLIGGSATALYALSVFLPIIHTLDKLSRFN